MLTLIDVSVKISSKYETRVQTTYLVAYLLKKKLFRTFETFSTINITHAEGVKMVVEETRVVEREESWMSANRSTAELLNSRMIRRKEPFSYDKCQARTTVGRAFGVFMFILNYF